MSDVIANKHKSKNPSVSIPSVSIPHDYNLHFESFPGWETVKSVGPTPYIQLQVTPLWSRISKEDAHYLTETVPRRVDAILNQLREMLRITAYKHNLQSKNPTSTRYTDPGFQAETASGGRSIEGRILTEAEKRMIDKYKALANASKPGNFTQGYLPGFTSADPYKFPYRIAPFSSRFPRNVPPYVAEARLPRRVHAIVNQLGEMSKAKLPKGKGIGFWGPFSGALMTWFLWPHIKEFAYGIGLGQPITAAQQRLSGKPIDWGTLRDPAVEHYFDTQYKIINPQF